MNVFSIDFNVLLQILLPLRKRKLIRQSWLAALISPVVYLYQLFLNQRQTHLYTLSHTSQVVYMQAILNDRFDMQLRRIYISDTPDISPQTLFTNPEQKYAFLYTTAENENLPLYTQTEIAGAQNGFILNIPAILNVDHVLLSALVDAYRLPSKNKYIIQTF
jgi:hypothetical protein